MNKKAGLYSSQKASLKRFVDFDKDRQVGENDNSMISDENKSFDIGDEDKSGESEFESESPVLDLFKVMRREQLTKNFVGNLKRKHKMVVRPAESPSKSGDEDSGDIILKSDSESENQQKRRSIHVK